MLALSRPPPSLSLSLSGRREEGSGGDGGRRYISRRQRRRRNERINKTAGLFGAIIGAVVLYKFVSDVLETTEAEKDEKERVLVLGSGFGALGFVGSLDPKRYDIHVISPRGYFLYTPLLSESIVGGVQIESIVEPIRSFEARTKSKFDFAEARCVSIDPKENKITCRPATLGYEGPTFDLDYDHLVIAVGARNDTFDVKGVKENVNFLDSLNDARRIRNRVLDAFETASLPGAEEEEKKRVLHFVVVGGGPVARTAAAHLSDYVEEMVKEDFPELSSFAKVSLIPYNDHIHNFYDHTISDYFRKETKRSFIDKLSGNITAVDSQSFSFQSSESDEISTIPYGTMLWTTGKAPHPFIKEVQKTMPSQSNVNAILVDQSLRVKGTKNIWAVGDCATITQGDLLKKWEQIFAESDVNNDGVIDQEEFHQLCLEMGKKYPALLEVADRSKEWFAKADVDSDGTLDVEEFQVIMEQLDDELTRYPTTAGVAVQQGQFLAQLFNDDTQNEEERDSFRYKHIGGYEYVGAEDGLVERGSNGGAIVTGWGAWWMWSNVYYSNLVGIPMRLRVGFSSWFTKVFGREVTRY
eukprot:TRINITY_DN2157_c1_g1_i1.p1 TRINITY_DN2157_c1_g1~~TRINITY_DN2157_c1_g1_i1.p1  ORF type:complete len:625 (-),score=194.46 TRINITY_DN2157_c1_g1_i1:202-1947(-)